jgi:hypothetical protein
MIRYLFVVWLGLLACASSAETPWALRPLQLPAVPEAAGWGRTPIDAYILARLKTAGIEPALRADNETLLRRVTFDITGLPPTLEAREAFLADGSPEAFAKVVDRLLASPRYGERWARHWMDIVHYAETHGHDEDAIRENAWPYRDYLIRSFNEDKPYAQFVREQMAGDVLYPEDPWATIATGFLACGPWDESSQMGIQDGTIDKKVAQYLDRDDMLTTTMSTFISTTVHCARCHDHKFDPIPMREYYELQSVFAGIDRVDRPYDDHPEVTQRRRELIALQHQLDAGKWPETIEPDAAFEAWVENARGSWRLLDDPVVTTTGASSHKALADGSFLFGEQRPETDTYTFTGSTSYTRVTAVMIEVLTDASLDHLGPGRQDNGNLHLSEIQIRVGGQALAIGHAKADFSQDGWTIEHAMDGNPKTAWGIYPKVGTPHRAMFVLAAPVELEPGSTIAIDLEQLHGGGHLIGRPRITVSDAALPSLPSDGFRPELAEVLSKPVDQRTPEDVHQLAIAYQREQMARERAALDQPRMVYAVASDWEGRGNYKPAKGLRPIHLLARGDIHQPGELMQPGALSCLPKVPFPLSDTADEGARRAALAHWLADPGNVLTWRSMANRVWTYHFGRGIVTTPNDLGKMGATPSHPGLLDWLACQLRDNGGSLKALHRLICTSEVYAQRTSSDVSSATIPLRFVQLRRLDAESLRDALLQMSGKLDLTMGGPSARQFTATKGVHVTPNLDYLNLDPDDPVNLRRSVYRFVFRTVPDPFMQVLDCPDASQLTPIRDVSITPLQALALMNNPFLIRQCEHLAVRLERASPDLEDQITHLFLLAYCREPRRSETQSLMSYAKQHGLANACRVIINSSEHLFVN